MKLIMEMPEGWTYAKCVLCGSMDNKIGDCGIAVDNCPLAKAQEVVEVKGGLSRAIATQFDGKEGKVYFAAEVEGA